MHIQASRKSRTGLLRLLSVCCLLVLLSAPSASARKNQKEKKEKSEAQPYFLLGAKHRNNTNFGEIKYASFAGGLEFFLEGDGFNNKPHKNDVIFTSQQVEDLVITGPELDRDDQLESAPSNGKLAYTLPSLPALFGTDDYTPFNNHFWANNRDENIRFSLSVKNTKKNANAIMVCDEESVHNCKARYSFRYTPQLYDISPNQVYDGQFVTLYINVLGANAGNVLPSDSDPVQFIKFGNTRNNYEGLFDFRKRLRGYKVDNLPSRAGDQPIGNSVPEVRFRVGNAIIRDSAKHCNFEGDDCWYIKTHPKIKKISRDQSFLTGGKKLTITGWGLKGENGIEDVSVTIDGVPCEVLSSKKQKIVCTIGAAESISNCDIPQPGSPGLSFKQYHVNSWDQFREEGLHVSNEGILTVFETEKDRLHTDGIDVLGWFKAPATGRFRFYISCDDKCELEFDATNKFNSEDPTTPAPEIIAQRHSLTDWRHYFYPPAPESPDQYISDWIELEEGEYYKMNGYHFEWSGEDHFTVSVEYEKPDTADHHHTRKEIQVLSIETDIVFEEFQIIIENASGSGKFKVQFSNPFYDPDDNRSEPFWRSKNLDDDIDAETLSGQLDDYFLKYFKSKIDVVKVDFDANDVETDQAELVVKSVYTVKLRKLINGPSFSAATIITNDQVATYSVTSQLVESTPPLNGRYKITCADENGDLFSTRDLNFNHWEDGTDFYVNLEIPHLQYKVWVRRLFLYEYKENSLAFAMIFQDYYGDVPQCICESSTSYPITGQNVQYKSEVIQEFGENLFFEPVPLYMLHTEAYEPQVRVTVNGIDAVCPDQNCGFKYISTAGEITSQSLDGLTLTIHGNRLPTEDLDITLANSECIQETIVATEHEITCTLDFGVAAGEWNVELAGPDGLTPINALVEPIVVGLTVTEVQPNENLNQLGGDILTITGQGFDQIIDNTSVVFDDGTSCTMLTSEYTQITCQVDGFNADTIDTENPYVVTVTVNGVSDSSLTVTLNEDTQSGVSVEPTSVSPVLIETLTITLEETYPDTLVLEDFTAELVSQSDPTDTRPLFVISIDDDSKTILLRFPGAETGDYFIQITSVNLGRIDESSLTLAVCGKITQVTPLSGSALGGTILTIDGVNFSDLNIENSVTVGNYQCLVLESSPTQIKCRIEETFTNVESQGEVIVFLVGTEEALSDGVDTTFQFVAPDVTLTALDNSFDAATNTHIFTATGTGLEADNLDSISLLLDGNPQETISVTDTTAVFTVTNALDETSSDVLVYVDSGLPDNYMDFVEATMTPTLVSIDPREGSAGGTLITVTVTGIGINTTGLGLIIQSSNEDICLTVTVEEYGSFKCLTKDIEITQAETLVVRTSSGDYACGNTIDADECTFEQLINVSPTITGITISSLTQIDIVGFSFPTEDVECSFTLQGVQSSSCTINDSTSITVIYSLGIPIISGGPSFQLGFTSTASSGRRRLQGISFGDFIIAIDDDVIITDDTVNTVDSTENLVCSFQGGCSYTVTYNGLATTINSDDTSYIEVCGHECVLDIGSSGPTEAVCLVPSVATAYSIAEFKIVEDDFLTDFTVSGTASESELDKLFDQDNTVDLIDADANCFFQVQFKDDYVGVLSEVSIFVDNLIDKTPFVDNLVLQGSDDGSTFTDLWTLDVNIHEGWNAINFEGNQPSFNIYRFQGAVEGSCRVGEVLIKGVESIDNDDTSYPCTPKLFLYGVDQEENLNPVLYDSVVTPKLTGMSKRFGSVLGGEEIEFYGTNFSDSATTTVFIDDRECTVTSTTVDTITCTTDDKPYRPDEPTLVLNIDGKGNVATQGKIFLYVSHWSEPQTWNFDLSPREGEAIHIPKGLHLLVDVDTTPVLSFINVEGSLIFPPDSDPNHERTLDAQYIVVKDGYMEAGTEENRYTSKLTITLHGDRETPQLPIYGNKVIAVNYGELEMHGIERPVTWTDLFETAEVGATSITLNTVTGDPLDWAVGEEIVIASSDFVGRNAEKRTIETITDADTNPVITFTEPLEFKHYAGVQTFGASDEDSIEMRAEVGLLTRNVKFQGDIETSEENEYGAVIVIHSPGDESSAARIDSVELFNVGQAYQLGANPINFHLIGTVHDSYIRNNAIHQSFNRAVNLNGVHYLRVENNVAYNTKGHSIYLQNAFETKNYIKGNLIVDVRSSWSLQNSDQTPAAFWISNPDNIILNNHAAGSDQYSYWYSTQKTATGPQFDANICPENTKLGEFRENVGHSNGRYGLRILYSMIPRENPCEPMIYDPTDPSDPYPTNRPITAEFINFVSWKNGRNGAIAERVGAVQFVNFKTADNIYAGMEVSQTDVLVDGFAKIVGGFVVGRTENTETDLDNANPFGIVTPRTENFSIEGTRFYNYNFRSAAGLGTCSQCNIQYSTDSGARTVRVSNLGFDDTTTLRIRYNNPMLGIFLDETGDLTNKGPGSWAVPNRVHLRQPECEVVTSMGGITCDNTIQVRRIVFDGYEPDTFRGKPMRIAPYDIPDVNQLEVEGALEDFEDDISNYDRVYFRYSAKPSNSWAVPFVTGHRYRIHWEQGLDFTKMRFSPSERWEENDLNTFFNLNFTDTREAVNFTTEFGEGYQIFNESMIDQPTTMIQTGDNWILNDTETREINFVVNGRNPEERSQILMEGLRCISGSCALELVEDAPIEAGTRLWSDAANWEGSVLPQDGDDVVIPAEWNLLLDIGETPILNSLTINGRLTFYNNNFDVNLRAKKIFVRAGELLIGTEDEPFQANAQITLFGKQEEETLVFSGTTPGGNKILANVGDVKFYGLPRDQVSRLILPCNEGDTQFFVGTNLDWTIGDQLHLAPTAMQYDHSDYITVISYDPVTGRVVFDEPLNYYHWGSVDSTADDYNGVDMRGEVTLLTRNIKIQGEDVDGWGCQVLVSDYFESDGTWRKGHLHFDNVQVYNCSQQDTFNSAIRWQDANGGYSTVKNSVVHGSLGWSVSVYRANNVFISDSKFIGSTSLGVHTDFVRNFTMTDSFVSDVKPQDYSQVQFGQDKAACVALCSYLTNGSTCIDIEVTNNVAAGCFFAGFIAPGYDCDESDSVRFKDNIAHSVDGIGAAIYPDRQIGNQHTSCYELSHFSAYKTTEPCVATHYETREMRAHDLTCIDSQNGINLQTGVEADDILIKLSDSFIFAETEAKDCPTPQACYCVDKIGLMFFGNNISSKSLHIERRANRPIQKITNYSAYGGEVFIENVRFFNFNTAGLTDCQARQTIFARNPYASDKIPVHNFDNCKFVNVDTSSIAYFEDPNPEWEAVEECGNFPCTAPNNILARFRGTQFSGQSTPAQTFAQFQIIPDDPNIGGQVGGVFSDCTEIQAWQGYYCRDRSIAYLTFESLDSDSLDRSIQPIYLLNEEAGFNNTLNSMRDHSTTSFYTTQRRASRFPALVSTDLEYTLDISGTPPREMRFKIDADLGGVKIKIPYRVANSYAIEADGVTIDQTEWSEVLNTAAPLTNSFCGENRYVGVENFLEFYITNACEIKITPRDVIQTKLRLEWTVEEFYANGGVTRFIDRLSASLDIPASRIKTVAIYEGSTIVDFLIIEDKIESESKGETAAEELAELTTKLVTQINEGSLDIGSPILGLQGDDGTVLAGDPIPDPEGFVGTTTNANDFESVDTAAIIRDGPNLWDGIVPDAPAPVVEEETVQEPATPEPTVEQPVVEEPKQDNNEQPVPQTPVEEPATVPEPSPAPEELSTPAERPIKEVITKIIVYEEEEYTVQPETADTDSKSSVTAEDGKVETSKAKKFLIVIPAIVVVLLVAVAISIAVKSCNKKRERHVISIKEQMENRGELEQDVQDHQFAMEDGEKNIFSRPADVTPTKSKRVRIHVADDSKATMDNLSQSRIDDSSIMEDGFTQVSMTSSKKFDMKKRHFHSRASSISSQSALKEISAVTKD